jgi:7,8-dihydroneopterin aldolase/epimerase/oxygenase
MTDMPATQTSSTGAMDIVFLHDLKVDAVIGLWDWERQFKQTLHIDVDLGTDISAAGRSDSIDDTVDYKSVTKRIMQIAETGGFLLVEALAEAIASAILTEFNVKWLRLRINKKSAVRQARDVGVMIERMRVAG